MWGDVLVAAATILAGAISGGLFGHRAAVRRTTKATGDGAVAANDHSSVTTGASSPIIGAVNLSNDTPRLAARFNVYRAGQNRNEAVNLGDLPAYDVSFSLRRPGLELLARAPVDKVGPDAAVDVPPIAMGEALLIRWADQPNSPQHIATFEWNDLKGRR